MKTIIITLATAVTFYGDVMAQQVLTLEDIYRHRKFSINSVQGLKWMKNGDFYTALKNNEDTGTKDIIRYSTTSGQLVDTLVHGHNLLDDGKVLNIHGYALSDDESKVLISTDYERIYRRSSKSRNYVYSLHDGKLSEVGSGAKVSYATFSPDGTKLAYVYENNLYFDRLDNDAVVQVTNDGYKNAIINGFADWVHEEELSLAKAFFWSPDGSKLAFLRFDESEVPEYTIQKWRGLYPENYALKYPKAGEKNAEVSLHIYDLPAQRTVNVPLPEPDEESYLARLRWLPVGKPTLSIVRLNRLQNRMDIIHFDTQAQSTSVVYTEQSETYLDIDQIDDLTYPQDGKSFILSSERSGFKHLYHYALSGKPIRQLTFGEWSVDSFEGIDEKKGLLYFTSTEVSATERHLYSLNLEGKEKKRLSTAAGVHRVNFSDDFSYYINTHSNAVKPPTTVLHLADGGEVKVLAENTTLLQQSKSYKFATTEYFSIPLTDGDSLNAYIMKPADFSADKRYPVLMYVYGGPGSQNVLNRWNGNMWHHLLTQKGYLVVCADNRGTGGRGRAFQHITYKKLGKIESEDQIASARYLSKLSYVDKDRIGIWGWSYGGYLSSLCLFLGNDVFKTAIAVAPVSSWRFYDTIYTERYLQKPQQNAGGYDDHSPISHAHKLSGSLLLVHGTGDDNVHFQNTVELQNALISANKQFSSFYYPDRNHGIYGGNTRLHLYTMMTDFILQNL
jgi:dipeptidyl-peptidase-4